MGRILVVDDEANIRMTVKLALQHVGHTVETASDGPEGLEKFGDGMSFDLCLLDQRMPGMEGIDVLREMKKREPQAKIIMATAFGTIDLAIEAMKLGATDFIRKPFTAETLRGTIDTMLAMKPGTSPGFSEIALGMTTINGFRIEYVPSPVESIDDEFSQEFTLKNPAGASAICNVSLESGFIQDVRNYANRKKLPNEPRFFQAICEESLANYLWQNAEFPENGQLLIEELNNGLKRYVDDVLAR